jgi:uncharacterized protein YndB with AHSA1/START domain
MSERDEAVVIECDLEATPDQAWRALTDPDLVERWLAPAEAGVELGEPAELEPGREVRYRWRDADARESTVTFTLTETGAGVHLRIVHEPVVVLACARPRRARSARAVSRAIPRAGMVWRRAA